MLFVYASIALFFVYLDTPSFLSHFFSIFQNKYESVNIYLCSKYELININTIKREVVKKTGLIPDMVHVFDTSSFLSAENMTSDDYETIASIVDYNNRHNSTTSLVILIGSLCDLIQVHPILDQLMNFMDVDWICEKEENEKLVEVNVHVEGKPQNENYDYQEDYW